MDIRAYNREAWNRQVARQNPWTIPVNAEEIAAARRGELRILLTPTRWVPAEPFPPLNGAEVLCLASGGGQQGLLLAAGFVLTGFYEDIDPSSVLGEYIPSYIATRAVKP